MANTLTVNCICEIDPRPQGIPSDATLMSFAQAVFEKIQIEHPVCVDDRLLEARCLNCVIASRETSQALNATYRQKDKPTNVLSFPENLALIEPDTDEPVSLGELVLCAEVIEDEAEDQEKSLEAHWCHMIVHGMLHLYGYDHVTDADAERMETLECTLLHSLGFDRPY